jgi:tryptophan 2,3-dioxygenase
VGSADATQTPPGHGSGEPDDEFAPILEGPGASDYERYLRTDELLALQKTEGEWAHRDELLFQTVHQSSELWLKLAWNEVEVATLLDMLERMSPWEYTRWIRPVLGHGSGFDSPGFRRIREVSPELGQAFHEARRERGLSVVELYQQGREHEDLYQLAEALIEWDERLILWRVRHYKVVARVIGDEVVGTQGTPVELLGGLIKHKLYPELWQARNELTAAAKEEE